MDNSEFIAQLATFSQLEQLTKISDSVETLSTISESMSRLEDKVAALEDGHQEGIRGDDDHGHVGNDAHEHECVARV